MLKITSKPQQNAGLPIPRTHRWPRRARRRLDCEIVVASQPVGCMLWPGRSQNGNPGLKVLALRNVAKRAAHFALRGGSWRHEAEETLATPKLQNRERSCRG